jgi:hypothetical protein
MLKIFRSKKNKKQITEQKKRHTTSNPIKYHGHSLFAIYHPITDFYPNLIPLAKVQYQEFRPKKIVLARR